MPKSSIAIRTPSCLISPSRRAVSSTLRIRVVSVISIVSAAGCKPAGGQGGRDVDEDLVAVELASGDVDRDADRVPFGAPGGCLRAGVSSTQRPTSTIRPVSSSSGMKSSGWTVPRVGWRQRISASTPFGLMSLRSNVGW